MVNSDVAVIMGIVGVTFTVLSILKSFPFKYTAVGFLISSICILIYLGAPLVYSFVYISGVSLLFFALCHKQIKNYKHGFDSLFITVFLLVVLVNIVLLFGHGVNTPVPSISSDYIQKTPEPEIKINYNSETAQMQEIISGTAKNIPDGYKLCILVYSKDAYRYYPQNTPLETVNGEWSVPVTIGTKGNVGTQSEIIAVLANKDARAAFTSYMVNCNKTGNWQGMLSIPDGATEYARITVTRV